jgi:hypothetical protein
MAQVRPTKHHSCSHRFQIEEEKREQGESTGIEGQQQHWDWDFVQMCFFDRTATRFFFLFVHVDFVH